MAVLSVPALKAEVNNWIKTNNNREITGQQMNTVLIDIIDSMVNQITNIDLLGMREYDPTYTYHPTMGCFVGQVIYKAKVQTTGTFAPDDWEQVTGVQQITLLDFVDLVNNETLNLNIYYYIKELDFLIQPVSTSELVVRGVKVLYLPDPGVVSWIIGVPNTIGEMVQWDNRVFETTGGSPTGDNPVIDTGTYTPVTPSTNPNEFVRIVLDAQYDLTANCFTYFRDEKGNEWSMDYDYYTTVMGLDPNDIYLFSWGKDAYHNNKMKNSKVYSCNQIGSMTGCEFTDTDFDGENVIIAPGWIRNSKFTKAVITRCAINEEINIEVCSSVALDNVGFNFSMTNCVFKSSLTNVNFNDPEQNKIHDLINGSSFEKILDVASFGGGSVINLSLYPHVGKVNLSNTSGADYEIDEISSAQPRVLVNGVTVTNQIKFLHGAVNLYNKGAADFIITRSNEFIEYKQNSDWFELNSANY